MSDITYTEDDLKAAVDAATAPLASRIKDLETSQQVSEVESAKAEIRAEFEARIAELQSQLDVKVLEAATEKERADGIVAWLDSEKAAAAEREVLEARKEERLTKVREVASQMPEDYLTANAERFAAMSDEAFEFALDALSNAHAGSAAGTAAGTGTSGDPKPPATTGLHASRESTTSTNTSATKDIFALRRNGRFDPSNL